MDRRWPLVAGLVLLVPSTAAQPPLPPPDLGPASQALDDVAGRTLPPALAALGNATGQNLTREDVRITVDLNFSKADVNGWGLLVGSGKAELQVNAHARVEMRVISSDRVRAVVQGENAYNVSAENATFLSEVFLPAEAFRATVAAEAVAAFQRDQEAALVHFLETSAPELRVLAASIAWGNVHPYQAATDLSLTEPPIVVDLDVTFQYLRVESVRTLLATYFATRDDPARDARRAYIEELKAENGDALRSRDFFAAAAYTQLLNLSLQPGWSLAVNLSVPRGYSFTYANSEVTRADERHIAFAVDALSSDTMEDRVFLASLTHKRAVAFVLFGALWAVGLVLAFPFRWAYVRRRLAVPATVPDPPAPAAPAPGPPSLPGMPAARTADRPHGLPSGMLQRHRRRSGSLALVRRARLAWSRNGGSQPAAPPAVATPGPRRPG